MVKVMVKVHPDKRIPSFSERLYFGDFGLERIQSAAREGPV